MGYEPPDNHDDGSAELVRTPAITWADDLYDRSFPPLRYVVDGMIAEGTMFMLAGRPKAGKSWLLLNLVRSLADGTEWLGRKTDRLNAPIAYFPLEDGERRIWERMHCMAWRPPRETVALIFDRIDLSADRGGTLSLLHDRYGFRVFVIDTMRAAIGDTDENDNSTMGALLTRIATICHDLGITLILNHHTRKGTTLEDAFDGLRGASATRGSYDGGAVMFRAKNEDIATLALESRDIDVRDLTIEWRGVKQGWQLLGYAEEVSMTKLEDKILDALADSEKTLHQLTEILEANTSAVYHAVRRLIADQRVVQRKQPTGGRGAPRSVYALAETHEGAE